MQKRPGKIKEIIMQKKVDGKDISGDDSMSEDSCTGHLRFRRHRKRVKNLRSSWDDGEKYKPL